MPATLKCINCNKVAPIEKTFYRCDHCGDLLDVFYSFDPVDCRKLKIDFLNRKLSFSPQDQSGVWRFRELLPFVRHPASIISLREGNTPLWEVPSIAKATGLQHLAVKHQGMNPTGSFKDNGMTTAITQAKQLGMRTVICASTGNTSASMAAYAARAGMRAIIFIPSGQIALGKLAQAMDFGATVVQLDGDFDVAMKLAQEAAREGLAYLLNSVNPFRLEGQKTILIELMEQRGWRPPDWIVLPGGNLGNCSAFGKALHELFELKMITRLPKLVVVQAAGANPFFRMVRSQARNLTPLRASTLATAIRIGNPVSWKKALRAIERTQGEVIEVSEEEMADARALLARDGVGCEPASASAVAGILKLTHERKIMLADEVVAILTGHQLKDPEYILQYHEGTLRHEGQLLRSGHRNSFRTIPATSQAIRELMEHDA